MSTGNKKAPAKKAGAVKPETVVVTRNGYDKKIDIKLLDNFLEANWKRK